MKLEGTDTTFMGHLGMSGYVRSPGIRITRDCDGHEIRSVRVRAGTDGLFLQWFKFRAFYAHESNKNNKNLQFYIQFHTEIL